MKLSAGLALAGIFCLGLQVVWAPGDAVPMPFVFVPLVVGMILLFASIVLDMARGTGLYRTAVVVGLVALLTIGVALAFPLDRGVAGPRSSPTNAEIVLLAGIALAVVSVVAGTIAIARSAGARDSGRPRSESVPPQRPA